MNENRNIEINQSETTNLSSIRKEFKSSHEGLGEAISDFQDLLEKNGYDKESILVNGFDEALQNAIMYGNGAITEDENGRKIDSSKTNKLVHVDFYVDPQNIKIVITDEGDGFDYEILEKNSNKAVDDSIKLDFGGDRGRGTTWVNFMYDSEYSNGGRTITLTHPKKTEAN